MKNKKLYLIPIIFSLVVFFSVTLLFAGCYIFDPQYRAVVDQDAAREEAASRAEEQTAKKEEKLAEVEQTVPAEELKTTEEGAKLNSSEVINYSGIVNEATVILIVDLKTAEVTGSINLSGDDYINATVDGKINIDTFEIDAKYSGTGRLESEGQDYPVSGTIDGKITDDLSTFKGTIRSDYGEDSGTEFIAEKDD